MKELHCQTQPLTNFEKLARSGPVIFAYSCIQGIGGVAVLLFFISLFYSPVILPLGLPLLIAFNSAAAGFALIERKKEPLFSQKLELTAVGIIVAVGSTLLLPFFCPWESPLDPVNHIQSIVISLPLTFLGGWIAVLSHNTRMSVTQDIKEE